MKPFWIVYVVCLFGFGAYLLASGHWLAAIIVVLMMAPSVEDR